MSSDHCEGPLGFLPMFPLGRPCLPGEVLALKVFEARYLTMFEHLRRATTAEFGIVMIERGNEVGGGDIRRLVGTAVSIERVTEVTEGLLAVVAVGQRRIRVLEWLPDDPYPRAAIQSLPEISSVSIPASLTESAELLDERILSLFHSGRLEHIHQDRRAYAIASSLKAGSLDLQTLLEQNSLTDQLVVLSDILRHLEDLSRFRSSNHP